MFFQLGEEESDIPATPLSPLDNTVEDEVPTSQQKNKKKSHVPVSSSESLMLMRSYVEHLNQWGVILTEMRGNKHLLPRNAAHLYDTAQNQQLHRRMREHISRLMAGQPPKDAAIAALVTQIKAKERVTMKPMRASMQQKRRMEQCLNDEDLHSLDESEKNNPVRPTQQRIPFDVYAAREEMGLNSPQHPILETRSKRK